MLETPDVAVLGSGPAGLRAALASRSAGLTVLLVDEAPAAGGQGAYRAPPDGSRGHGADGRRCNRLRRALARSDVVVLTNHRVWTASTSPIGLSLAGPSPIKTVRPRALLVCAGATERVMPFPGWTLPGVIGLGAATVLLKTPGPLPIGPVVVAGRGPLLAQAAAGLVARGVSVACVVDEARRREWLRVVPNLVARPGLLTRGALWLAQLRWAGVKVLHGHVVVAARGEDAVAAVVVRPVDSGPERTIPAALLAVGHGFVPATELLSLLGVPLHHRPAEGAWTPDLQPGGRTEIPGVYAAGDGAGIRGAEAAELAGHLAGLAIAEDLGTPSRSRRRAGLARRLRRADRAGAAMARLMAPTPQQIAAMSADTVVCRCEDVTRATVDAVLSAGAADLNQLKTRTRCGMGPCGGRVCAPAVAALAGLHPHVTHPLRPWTVRPPLRPMPLGDLVGAFTYADVPSVKPAI